MGGGCNTSHRNRCSKAGRKLSDLYMDLIWQSQWGRRNPRETKGLKLFWRKEFWVLTRGCPLFLLYAAWISGIGLLMWSWWLGRWVCSEIELFAGVWLRETVNDIAIYLWMKFRTIPFFIVLLGTWQSDFLCCEALLFLFVLQCVICHLSGVFCMWAKHRTNSYSV